MSLPSQMKVLKVQEPKKASVVDAPLPKLRDDYILVKVSAVALNPTDWKHIDFLASPGATVGCDYAGTVVEVGKSVTKSLKKGDRVAGFVHGVNSVQPEDGAFGEYLVTKDGVQVKIPENVSDEDAATLGVGITTIGQGLYQSLGLPLPDAPSKEKTPVLIYGGSTATGLFAIQWAKLSGLTVITTCRPHNFDLVKSYGADAAFDYSDATTCSQQIRDYTSNGLKYAFDCISEHSSTQICADSLSTTGGSYSSLLAVKFPQKEGSKVDAKYTLAYTAVGEKFEFRGGTVFEAKPEDYEFGKKVWSLAEMLLAEGKFRVPPLRAGKGGLGGVLDGLDQLRQGKVSGEKLVYKF